MPELPEVETMVRDMIPVLSGRVFQSALLTHTDILSGVTGRALIAGLTGARVLRLERRAKNAVIVTIFPDSADKYMSERFWQMPV